ncbi:hypothetical protein AgCh_017441 [Apium graveolens]
MKRGFLMRKLQKNFRWRTQKISAYPFSRDRVVELITEEAKELRLEMLWEPNSVFGGKFGSVLKRDEELGSPPSVGSVLV